MFFLEVIGASLLCWILFDADGGKEFVLEGKVSFLLEEEAEEEREDPVEAAEGDDDRLDFLREKFSLISSSILKSSSVDSSR